MTTIDPESAAVILATDCGSTTTKAILIQKVDGVYRQTHRGEAPTTVEEPFADVTIGVANAVTEVAELAGRRLVDDKLYANIDEDRVRVQLSNDGALREQVAENLSPRCVIWPKEPDSPPPTDHQAVTTCRRHEGWSNESLAEGNSPANNAHLARLGRMACDPHLRDWRVQCFRPSCPVLGRQVFNYWLQKSICARRPRTKAVFADVNPGSTI